jgi:hypothetical protein
VATQVITGNGAFAARFTVYASVQALASVFFLLAVREMDRHRLVAPDTPASLFRRSYHRMGVLIAAFGLSIPVAYVTRLAYLCWIGIPFAMGLVHRLTTGRASDPSAMKVR